MWSSSSYFWAQPLNEVDVGSINLAEELASVCRQRLHVATLTLSEDRVEGERGLARTGEPRKHDERIARDFEIHILQIVNARPTYFEHRRTELCGAGDG